MDQKPQQPQQPQQLQLLQSILVNQLQEPVLFITPLVTDKNELLIVADCHGNMNVYEFDTALNQFKLKWEAILVDYDSFDHTTTRVFFHKTKSGHRILVGQSYHTHHYYVWGLDESKQRIYSSKIESIIEICPFERFNKFTNKSELCVVEIQQTPSLMIKTKLVDFDYNSQKGEFHLSSSVIVDNDHFEDSCFFQIYHATQKFGYYDYNDLKLPKDIQSILSPSTKNALCDKNGKPIAIRTFVVPKEPYQSKVVGRLYVGHENVVNIFCNQLN